MKVWVKYRLLWSWAVTTGSISKTAQPWKWSILIKIGWNESPIYFALNGRFIKQYEVVLGRILWNRTLKTGGNIHSAALNGIKLHFTWKSAINSLSGHVRILNFLFTFHWLPRYFCGNDLVLFMDNVAVLVMLYISGTIYLCGVLRKFVTDINMVN